MVENDAGAADVRRIDGAGDRDDVEVEVRRERAVDAKLAVAVAPPRCERGEVREAQVHRLLQLVRDAAGRAGRTTGAFAAPAWRAAPAERIDHARLGTGIDLDGTAHGVMLTPGGLLLVDRRQHGPRLVGMAQQRGLGTAAADEVAHLRGAATPRDMPSRPFRASRAQVGRRERQAFRSLTLPFGTTSSIACGLSSRVSHLGHDVPRIDRQRRSCEPRAARAARSASPRAAIPRRGRRWLPKRRPRGRCASSGPVTNALQPSATARS